MTRKILCDIAHFAFEVVNDWLSRDQTLARDLRSSKTGSRQVVGEEAITVDLATRLLSQFPTRIEFTLFTHPEESQTGADWYWRVDRGNDAIHARVQAKRVQRTAFGESDADGHIDIDSPQLERLLDATRTAAQRIVGLKAWLAIYARVSATPPCGCANLLSCRLHHHAEACANGEPSLWIANAGAIADSRMRQPSIVQIVNQSVRLDCVLPCTSTQGEGAGPGSKGFALTGGLQPYEECLEIITQDAVLRSSFQGALRIVV